MICSFLLDYLLMQSHNMWGLLFLLWEVMKHSWYYDTVSVNKCRHLMFTLTQLVFFSYLSVFIENSSSIGHLFETNVCMSYWSGQCHSSFSHFNSYGNLAFYKGLFSSPSELNITSVNNIRIYNKIWVLTDL